MMENIIYPMSWNYSSTSFLFFKVLESEVILILRMRRGHSTKTIIEIIGGQRIMRKPRA
jgi:hypothetical protein